MSKLQQLDEGLWVAQMPACKAGFELGARMTVIRLPQGGLWVHSPISLTPELQRELNALGHVWHIVAPSKMHYEHVPEFAKAYSTARVFGGPKVREKLDCVPHMEELTEKPDPAWAGVIDQTCFSGSLLYDEADFYHRASRTLILTDLLFNIPRESDFTTRLWAGLLGVLGKPSRSRSFDVSALERGDVRQSLERMLRWDFDRIILSHGNIVPQHGREVLRAAFAPYLKGSTAPAPAPVTERAR